MKFTICSRHGALQDCVLVELAKWPVFGYFEKNNVFEKKPTEGNDLPSKSAVMYCKNKCIFDATTPTICNTWCSSKAEN